MQNTHFMFQKKAIERVTRKRVNDSILNYELTIPLNVFIIWQYEIVFYLRNVQSTN